MKKKLMKTKDRKKIIRMLNLRLRIIEKQNRNYYEKMTLSELENSRMRHFIRSYASYIKSKGCDKDKREFKRLMENVGGDDARWL